MTRASDSAPGCDTPAPQSSLPFDPAGIIRSGVRVNMATLAKMCGVSKQAVSSWRRRGLFSLGADGLCNPTEAMQQVARNADPARLRAKALADPMREAKRAREENNALRQQLAQLREQVIELQSTRIGTAAVNLAAYALAEEIAELLPHLQAEVEGPQGEQRVALRVAQLFYRLLYDDDAESLCTLAPQFDLPVEPALPGWFPIYEDPPEEE